MSEPDDKRDTSLASDSRFGEALRRVNYAPGMLLGIEATRAEQDYHRRRTTRVGLHGANIAPTFSPRYSDECGKCPQ